METKGYISYEALRELLDKPEILNHIDLSYKRNLAYMKEAELQCWSTVEYSGGDGTTAHALFMDGVRSALAVVKAATIEAEYQEELAKKLETKEYICPDLDAY